MAVSDQHEYQDSILSGEKKKKGRSAHISPWQDGYIKRQENTSNENKQIPPQAGSNKVFLINSLIIEDPDKVYLE